MYSIQQAQKAEILLNFMINFRGKSWENQENCSVLLCFQERPLYMTSNPNVSEVESQNFHDFLTKN